MAHADRMTLTMSPLATKWYDGVKAHVVADHRPNVQVLMRKMEAPVLEGLYELKLEPCISADFFRWSVARSTWRQLCREAPRPFPFEDEMPATFGTPCSQQYVCHWYTQIMAERRTSGPRTQVGSSAELTSVQERAILAQRVRPEPMVPADGCEPLAFPLPKVRQPELCLGPRDDLEKTMVEAAAILGPEFTLACFYGGQEAHMIVFGLAPGVDANDERVLSRAREPIDWVEDWWVNVLEKDTNLLSHLQLQMRQRSARSHEDVSGRITTASMNLKYRENSGANMADEDVAHVVQAQQLQLESYALRIISQSVAETQGWENRGKELASFIENGHPQVHVLNREERLRVVRGLVRENALAFIQSLVSDTTKATASSLDRFIEIGDPSVPYISNVVDRMNVVEEAMSRPIDMDVLMLLEVRQVLLSWQQRLS